MRDGRELLPPARSIEWSVLDIDKIVVENHSKWAGLQIADCVTSAFFSGVEPNAYGNSEPQYAHLLKARLLRARGTCLNAGLTAVPSLAKGTLNPEQEAFFQFFSK